MTSTARHGRPIPGATPPDGDGAQPEPPSDVH
jgi:hypothetical protein